MYPNKTPNPSINYGMDKTQPITCINQIPTSVLGNQFVMPVCMASYMTAGYRHANHAFRVNVRSYG
jgi:hypothetical protein